VVRNFKLGTSTDLMMMGRRYGVQGNTDVIHAEKIEDLKRFVMELKLTLQYYTKDSIVTLIVGRENDGNYESYIRSRSMCFFTRN